jgi:hypothetical protein
MTEREDELLEKLEKAIRATLRLRQEIQLAAKPYVGQNEESAVPPGVPRNMAKQARDEALEVIDNNLTTLSEDLDRVNFITNNLQSYLSKISKLIQQMESGAALDSPREFEILAKYIGLTGHFRYGSSPAKAGAAAGTAMTTVTARPSAPASAPPIVSSDKYKPPL